MKSTIQVRMSKLIKCVIIDDDEMSRASLLRLCKKVESIEVVKTFQSALEAVDYLRNNDLDLLFLDIHMPELDGFDFLKSMKKVPKVIFTTSDTNRALEAFEVEAIDYLIKPITLPRFLSAIQRISRLEKADALDSSEHKSSYAEELFVHTDKRLVRISIDKVCIVEAKGDYILIKMVDGKMHVVRSTLKSIETRLPPTQFMRVHRSYIVNISKIVDIEDSSILVNNEVVPISRSYKSDVIEKLNLL